MFRFCIAIWPVLLLLMCRLANAETASPFDKVDEYESMWVDRSSDYTDNYINHARSPDNRKLMSLPEPSEMLLKDRVVLHSRRLTDEAEFKLLGALAKQPLRNNQSLIMFWRPQKVGSSTILSILMSFGYRYNLMPRRKDAANSFCSKIAQCALGLLKQSSNNSSSTSSSNQLS